MSIALGAPTITPLILPSFYVRITNENNGSLTNINSNRLENIQWAILASSNFLTRECGLRRFDEWREEREFTCLDERVGGDLLNPFTLQLDTDVRDLTQVKNGNGDVISLNNILLMQPNRDLGGVIDVRQIRIKQFKGIFWFSAGVDPYNAIKVDATWGYGGQWVDTTTALGSAVLPANTSIIATNGSALEQTMVLKVTSSSALNMGSIEYMYANNISGGTVSVNRGYNGSTPLNFDGGEELFYWQADIGIQQLVNRLTQFYFEQIKSPVMGQVVMGDLSYPVNVNGLPADLFKSVKDLGLIKSDGGTGV